MEINLLEYYHCKFINFFKRHNLYDEKAFKYIRNNSQLFDYRDEDSRCFIGTYYVFNDNKLKKLEVIVPFIDSEITMIINIHEYIHALDAYYKLGKKIKSNDTCEIKPLLFEKLYLLENKSDEGCRYLESLDRYRIQSGDKKYVLGKKVVDELLKKYNKDMNSKSLSKKSKILLLKYKYLK